MALNYVKIGKRMGNIRKHRGISQLFLAELIDKSPSYISYVENGLKCMSLDTLVAVANALEVSADDLLMDSINNTTKVSNHEFATLLADCTEYEKRVLLATAKALKETIRENQYYLYHRT